jgi:hypothetical protein
MTPSHPSLTPNQTHPKALDFPNKLDILPNNLIIPKLNYSWATVGFLVLMYCWPKDPPPPRQKKLVLELELQVVFLELLQWLPCLHVTILLVTSDWPSVYRLKAELV